MTVTALSPLIRSGSVNTQLSASRRRAAGICCGSNEVKGELDVKRELDLLVYLRKHGFPCPQPLDRPQGPPVPREPRQVRVACIAGSTASVDAARPPDARRASRTSAARSPTCTSSARATRRASRTASRFERVAELYGELRDRLPPYFRKIVRTLDDEVAYLEHYLEHKLPKGIIHGDIFHDNLLFKGEKLVAMLDFEAACRGKFIFDLATAVNALCFDGEGYDLKRFEALIAGYESVRPLSLAEWDAFPNELRLSALRFTVTRMRDFVPPYRRTSGARRQGLPGVLRAAPHPAPRARGRHGGAAHGDGHGLRLPQVPAREGAGEEGLFAVEPRACRSSSFSRRGRPLVSFEFFPPRTPEGEAALLRTIDALRPLGPAFVSVTRTGGKPRDGAAGDRGARPAGSASRRAVHVTAIEASRDEIARHCELVVVERASRTWW